VTPPSVTANLIVKLLISCPHCDAWLDLLQEDDCHETGACDDGAGWPAVKTWLRNEPHTPIVGTCDRCDKEFTVGGIEW